jgi:ABC-type bacteriocin/lantibiotic exporter with double-glycine peptidase domain
MIELYIWELVLLVLIVVLLGGIFIFILVSLLPLTKQLKKTAQQLEITASSLNKVINVDFKGLLNRGERVLENWEEELQPLIREKVRHIPSASAQFAFSEVGSRLFRVLILWALKEAWGKIRGKKKPKGS